MKTKLWPSGHSDDYAMIFSFDSKKDAVEKRKELQRQLDYLGTFCNGSLIVPYRIQNAYFVDYELDQDSKSRQENREFLKRIKKMGADITKVSTPRRDLERRVWLHFTLPKAEEIPLLDKEQIALVQNMVTEARRTKQPVSAGSTLKHRCTLPDGEKKSIYLFVNWESTPIKLLRSTFKNVSLHTPAGVFPISKKSDRVYGVKP